MEAHRTSYARRFNTKLELDDAIIKFYAQRMAYFAKNMGEKTIYGTEITQQLLRNTRKRYLTLLMRKYNVTNGQLPTINK